MPEGVVIVRFVDRKTSLFTLRILFMTGDGFDLLNNNRVILEYNGYVPCAVFAYDNPQDSPN